MNAEPAVPAATGGGPPTASLRGRAIRGSLVSVAQAVAANVIRLGSNLVLTRLLFPEAFGIMALIHTLMSGLHMVSDIGLHPIVINHGSAEQRWFRDTIWTIALVRGAMLTLLGLIAAWPMAVFYQEPDLVFYLPVVSLSAFVLGTTSVNWILAQRRLDFLRIASIEVGIQVVAAAATIGLAWWTRNEWALVVGSLFGPCFQSLMSHLAVPGDRDRIAWNPEVVDNVRRFGKWLFVSSIATFLAGRLDVLLLGRLMPMGVLGVYSLGSMIARLPQDLGYRAMGFVLQPALAAAIRKDPSRATERARQIQEPIVMAAGVPLLWVGLFAPAFFELFYDERYHEAATFAQLLVPAVWFSLLGLVASQTSLALGHSRPLALSNIVQLVATAAACLGGWALAGAPGFILGVGAGALAGYAVISYALVREGSVLFDLDLWATARLTPLLLLGVLAPVGLQALGGDPTFGTGLPVFGTAVGLVIATPFTVYALRNLRALLRG
ncbi:MAG TPA: oligosaccharide flippase family protein [Polyangiaceae bacterium LLY-WYZ-14_1]|nr:oligosaccharide flippase family protein [Polyangiaceae bacterium LLY-WYZ-14_1]